MTALAISRAPSRDLTSEQKLRTVLDALLDLGHGEVLLHGVPRAELIALAGIHRLSVACDDDIATRVTRVLHRDGKTLCWGWQVSL